MNMYEIITKKKNGGELTEGEIKFFVEGYTRGDIPDYQAAALMMAICIRSMSYRETAHLTEAIAHSGDVLDLSALGGATVDKHSSGGVGDKTTLIVAPLAASLGCTVAKMSGRGLGHTGGTVDKLESIPGYRAELSPEEFISQVEKIGIAVVAQSGGLAPADKKLYALRDVTATVDSIPLITASIMGKKLASGAESIVLDVKYGSGAFMKTAEDATALAEYMVAVGRECGRRVSALITDMDTPLGYAVGNALEVEEAIAVLSGEGPRDLTELCTALAERMASSALGMEASEARALVCDALSSGRAYLKFSEWISAQGGDLTRLPKAKFSREVYAPTDGFITKTDTEAVGKCASLLGAGRIKKEDKIDPTAGLILRKKTGDAVKRGEVLATLYASHEGLFERAEEVFLDSLTIEGSPARKKPLIAKIVE